MNVEIPSGLSVARGARKSEAACRLARECASRQASRWQRTDSGHVRRSEDCKGQSRMLAGGPERLRRRVVTTGAEKCFGQEVFRANPGLCA